MEFDPLYCDVIVARWQAFTGQEAVRESPAVADATGCQTPATTHANVRERG